MSKKNRKSYSREFKLEAVGVLPVSTREKI